MTYFGFLLCFLLIPIGILFALNLRDQARGLKLPPDWRSGASGMVLAILVVIAVVYTTPWDNYLVASRVWWYDPTRVVGLIIGWVPIEEYTFFVLQPILAGLWLLWLARRVRPAPDTNQSNVRPLLLLLTGSVWIISVVVLVSGWMPGKYLSIELAWALPPILLQLFVGANVLWQNRRLVALSIASLTIYLSLADTLAISIGIWTIDPQQSLNILIGGTLPIEEFVFFGLTNTLVVMGMVLALSKQVSVLIQNFFRRLKFSPAFLNVPADGKKEF